MSAGAGEPWLLDDPVALDQWVASGGTHALGRETNKWLAVIQRSAFMMRAAESSADRRKFRDTALRIIESARAAGGISDKVYLEYVIQVRMSYLRVSDEGAAWQRGEMEEVADIFFARSPFNAEGALERSANWRTLPVEEIRKLRAIKTLIYLLQPGIHLLVSERRHLLERWVEISCHLP